MTSEAKIAANRRNAQRSTGPRTTRAKMRVRRNALRHGLAAVIVNHSLAAAEVDEFAAAICGKDADPEEREQALIIAECDVTLRRVRAARVEVIEQMGLLLTTQGPDAPTGAPGPAVESNLVSFEQLLRLERYERRALSRRKRALRGNFTGYNETANGPEESEPPAS
jgi:hypothetical protein